MPGRYPRSLLLNLADSWNAAREAAVVEGPAERTVWIYRRVHGTGDKAGPAYLVLLEPARSRESSAGLPLKTEPGFMLLERCRPPAGRGPGAFSTARSGSAPVTGIVVVRSVYPEPRWRYAFNRWYNQHLPYVFTKGVFHTAYRYLATAPAPEGRLLHWAFYATDMADFARAMPGYMLQARDRERPKFPAYLDVLPAWMFEIVDSGQWTVGE